MKMNKFTITAEINPNAEYDEGLPMTYFPLGVVYSFVILPAEDLLNTLLAGMSFNAKIVEMSDKLANGDITYTTTHTQIRVIVKRTRVRKPYGKDTYK